jgi:hypothetical protein
MLKRRVLTSLHPIFTAQDHILSTAGDALMLIISSQATTIYFPSFPVCLYHMASFIQYIHRHICLLPKGPSQGMWVVNMVKKILSNDLKNFENHIIMNNHHSYFFIIVYSVTTF